MFLHTLKRTSCTTWKFYFLKPCNKFLPQKLYNNTPYHNDDENTHRFSYRITLKIESNHNFAICRLQYFFSVVVANFLHIITASCMYNVLLGMWSVHLTSRMS